MGPVLLAIFLAFQVSFCFSGGFCNNFCPQCSCVHAPPIVIPVRYMALPLKGLNVIPLHNGMNEAAPNCPININPEGNLDGPGGCGGPGKSGGYGGSGGSANFGYPCGLCNPRADVPQYLNCHGKSGCPEGPGLPEGPSSPGRPGYPKSSDFPGEPRCLGGSCYPLRPGCPGGASCSAEPGYPVRSSCLDGPGYPQGPGCPGRPGYPTGHVYPRGSSSSDVSSGPESPGFPGCSIIPGCLSCPTRDCECLQCLRRNCPMCPEGTIPCPKMPGDNGGSDDREGNGCQFICKPYISTSPPSGHPLAKPSTSDAPIYPYSAMPCQNQDNYCKSCIFQKGCRCDDSADECSGIAYGNGLSSPNVPSCSGPNVVSRPPFSPPSPVYGCKSFTHNYPHHGLMCGEQDYEPDYYPAEKSTDYGPDNPCNVPPDSLPTPDVPLCAKHFLVRSVRPVYDEYIKKVPIVQKMIRHEPVTTVKTVPYIKRNVVSKRERYFCQVPVVEKLKISDYQYQTKMVPCKKTRVVPTVQTVFVTMPVTEKIHKPLYKDVVKHVHRVCYRMKPVVQEDVIQVPIKEKSYRPVVVQRVVKVPIKSCVRKNFIEQKVHKSYGPCECCPCS